MREFYITLSDGTSKIIEAIDEIQIDEMFEDIVSIEEVRESTNRSRIKEFKEMSYDIYLESLYNDANKNQVSDKVKKTIRIIERNNRIPQWEKQFIYGLGRLINMGKEISKTQEERFEKIYNRIAR